MHRSVPASFTRLPSAAFGFAQSFGQNGEDTQITSPLGDLMVFASWRSRFDGLREIAKTS